MTARNLKNELEKLLGEFVGEFPVVKITGTAHSAFLFLENGRYAAEIYRDGKSFIVDPALDGTLLGEREYSTREEAIVEVRAWLKREGNEASP